MPATVMSMPLSRGITQIPRSNLRHLRADPQDLHLLDQAPPEDRAKLIESEELCCGCVAGVYESDDASQGCAVESSDGDE